MERNGMPQTTRRGFVLHGAAALALPLYASARRPKTVILGGCAFGLGHALAHPGETLVVERSIHLGGCFALSAGRGPAGKARSALGAKLLGRLERAGISKGGVLEAPPLADLLSVHFAESGGRALCGAETAAVERRGGKWRVTLFSGGSEGFFDVEADRVLDVTPLGWRNAGAEFCRGRVYGAITKDGEFSLEFPMEVSGAEARLAVHAACEKGRGPGSLLAHCNVPRVLYAPGRIGKSLGEGMEWVPSGQFADLMESFEEGAAWNFR